MRNRTAYLNERVRVSRAFDLTSRAGTKYEAVCLSPFVWFLLVSAWGRSTCVESSLREVVSPSGDRPPQKGTLAAAEVLLL